MTELFVPDDHLNYLGRPASVFDKPGAWGYCGPACCAVIAQKNLSEIMAEWEDQFGTYIGYAKWKQLVNYLRGRGYEVKRKRLKDGRIIRKRGYYQLCRVQWYESKDDADKPSYGWGHWAEATKNTHFILVDGDYFFCNDTGWLLTKMLSSYLKGKGVITSYLRVKKVRKLGAVK